MALCKSIKIRQLTPKKFSKLAIGVVNELPHFFLRSLALCKSIKTGQLTPKKVLKIGTICPKSLGIFEFSEVSPLEPKLFGLVLYVNNLIRLVSSNICKQDQKMLLKVLR